VGVAARRPPLAPLWTCGPEVGPGLWVGPGPGPVVGQGPSPRQLAFQAPQPNWVCKRCSVRACAHTLASVSCGGGVGAASVGFVLCILVHLPKRFSLALETISSVHQLPTCARISVAVSVQCSTISLFVYLFRRFPSGCCVIATPPPADGCFDDLYSLGKKIGAGAFGEVFLATNKVGGQEVAVKKIRKNMLFTPEERESVSREVSRAYVCMPVCEHAACFSGLETTH
jgi:hypothetical protein